MPRWITVTVRWVLAAALAVWAFTVLGPMALEELEGALAVDQDEEELPEVATAAGPPPLRAGTVAAVANVTSVDGTVRTPEGATVQVGPADADQLLVGFEPVPTDPACLAGVAMEIYLHDSSETSVYALPARVDDLRELEDGQGLPADTLLDRSNPGTAFTTGASGWLRFDVTGAYALAAREARPDTPVVLVVRLPDDVDADAPTIFSTVDDPEERPARLRWAAIDGCAREEAEDADDDRVDDEATAEDADDDNDDDGA